MEPGAVLNEIYSNMIAFLATKATVLVQDGQDLAGVLLLITVSWTVLNTWVLQGDGPNAAVEALSSLLKYFFVALLLGSWLSGVGGFFQGNVNDIAGKISGVNTIETATSSMFSAAKQLFSSTRAKDNRECVNVSDPSMNEFGLGQHVCPDPSGKGAEPSWMDILIHFPMVLFTVLLKLLALVFIIILITAFLLALFMAEVLFGLALCIGPILVPWIIWQRTEFLWDSWLKFMIAAAFTKIVAFFMVGVTAGLIATIKVTAGSINAKTGLDYLGIQEMEALVCCVVAAVGAFMMWQVQDIAGSLVGGSTGGSSSGFGRGSLGRIMPKGAANSIGGAANQWQKFDKAAEGSGNSGGGKQK